MASPWRQQSHHHPSLAASVTPSRLSPCRRPPTCRRPPPCRQPPPLITFLQPLAPSQGTRAIVTLWIRSCWRRTQRTGKARKCSGKPQKVSTISSSLTTREQESEVAAGRGRSGLLGARVRVDATLGGSGSGDGQSSEHGEAQTQQQPKGACHDGRSGVGQTGKSGGEEGGSGHLTGGARRARLGTVRAAAAVNIPAPASPSLVGAPC